METAMATKPHFQSSLFKFLRDLKRNNNKAWFDANRGRYERDVRDPLLRFITDFAAPLLKLSAHYLADARPTGGSLFRIHRDTRFSPDKTPYKTMAAAQFRHEAGKDVHAPGFYLHLAPGEVFAGVGLWHPEATALRAIRAAISDDPDGWKRAAHVASFTSVWELGGDSLSRPPRGFDAGHRFILDLQRKDFVAMTSFLEREACSAGFLGRFVEVCRRARPFMAFLTKAVGLPW
jgi:uncharacterized protein (TIGR02453 family)